MRAFDPGLLPHLTSHVGEGAPAAVERALALAERLALSWGVALGGWLAGGTCSLILTGVRRGDEVVLRVPLLDWEKGANLAAMRAFADHGGVPVLASDAASGAALIPRLRPGTNLAQSGLSEDAAVDACVALIRRLRGANGNGRRVEEYFDAPFVSKRDLAELPARWLDEGERVYRWLLASSPPPRLLHGDLHHFNVLRDGDAWIAIDPEGVMGDPAYETAAFLRNPVPEIADRSDLTDLLRRRIGRFSEGLNDPPERIWGWAFVRTLVCVLGGGSPFDRPWRAVVAALDAIGPEFSPT